MSDVLDRLGALGSHYRDPIEAIAWETADPELPWLPDSVLSLSGTSLGEAMTPAMRVRFSRVEFARLCAAGLWLEGLLIARVAADRFMDGAPTAERRVVLQEVREEAGHGLMFLEMIQRSGLEGVPLLGPTRLLTDVARRLHPQKAAFWAMVFIGETVTDTFAIRALKESGPDGQAICPVARDVLAFHHRDEARHIAAARTLLMARVAAMNAFDRLAFGGLLRFLLGRLLRATLYPTAASLAALGLEHPATAARAARNCPVRRAFALECAAPALELIERCVPGSGRGAKGE
jgi:hypothetical protein